jgi:HSP20 family molecular chaperone IbpA
MERHTDTGGVVCTIATTWTSVVCWTRSSRRRRVSPNSFGEFGFQFQKDADHRNYYAVYPFPPANIYMLPDRTMVFEFALAGYRDTDISLEFQGENMVLSAEAPDQTVEGDDVIFFNRRLKVQDDPRAEVLRAGRQV